LFYFTAAVCTCARNNPAIKLQLHIFLRATIAYKIVAAFILFYLILLQTFAHVINAAIYFIAAFIFITHETTAYCFGKIGHVIESVPIYGV